MISIIVQNLEWTKTHLSDVGSVASILGLLLTVMVWHGVRAIRRHYLFKIRVPQLLRRLNKLAGDINEIIPTEKVFNDNRMGVQVLLAECDVVLSHLNNHSLTRDTRKRISGVRTATRKHFKTMILTTHANVCDDFAAIRAVTEDVKNHVENANWNEK